MRKAVEGRRGVADYEFRVAQVEGVLRGMRASLDNAQMATLLNNLAVWSFIERVKGTPGDYHFAIPQLVRFCQEVGIDQLITNADTQCLKHPLTFEPVEKDGASASGT